MEVVLIGVGPLGRRHLEGLINSGVCKKIHIVDPSAHALKTALSFVTTNIKHWDELDIELNQYSSCDCLPKRVDLVIVATNSKVRLAAIKSFFKQSETTNIILEKFLFLKYEDYDEFNQIIIRHGTNAYVNTSRRAMESYITVKHELLGKKLKALSVEGDNWGLATSMIHFLDLFQFLTDKKYLDSVDFSGVRLDDSKSKRPGFQEMFGIVTGKFVDGPRFSIASKESKGETVRVNIFLENEQFEIDEVDGKILYSMNKTPKSGTQIKNFCLDYVSELTKNVVRQLAENQKIQLTPFKLSA